MCICVRSIVSTKKQVLKRATTWVNLKNHMLSERSQSQRTTYCMIPFIGNVRIHTSIDNRWAPKSGGRQ